MQKTQHVPVCLGFVNRIVGILVNGCVDEHLPFIRLASKSVVRVVFERGRADAIGRNQKGYRRPIAWACCKIFLGRCGERLPVRVNCRLVCDPVSIVRDNLVSLARNQVASCNRVVWGSDTAEHV